MQYDLTTSSKSSEPAPWPFAAVAAHSIQDIGKTLVSLMVKATDISEDISLAYSRFQGWVFVMWLSLVCTGQDIKPRIATSTTETVVSTDEKPQVTTSDIISASDVETIESEVVTNHYISFSDAETPNSWKI